jgi:hypothetical protein
MSEITLLLGAIERGESHAPEELPPLVFFWGDPDSTNYTHRFYRVVVP